MTNYHLVTIKNPKGYIMSAVVENEKLGYMSQKMIVDKVSSIVSEFVVFSDPEFKDTDWLSKSRLAEIIAQLGDKKVVTYQLKKAIKGSPDDQKRLQDGKAVKFTITDQHVSIAYYSNSSQIKEEKWRESHTYSIEKKVFDAYILVMQSDIAVAKKEKEQKSLENSSLKLD